MEVLRYQWTILRSQLHAMRDDLAEVRQEVAEFRHANKRHEEWEAEEARRLDGATGAMKAMEAKVLGDLEFVAHEVEKRQARQDEQVRSALREATDRWQKELAATLEEQSRLKARCAWQESVEVIEAALRREIAQVTREDQSRYEQHRELVELSLEQLDLKIRSECAQITKEQQARREDLSEQLHSSLGAAHHEGSCNLSRLTAQHSARHSELGDALKAAKDELTKSIADQIGTVFDAHHRDYQDLRNRYEDSLHELDIKIAEVEAMYSEAAEKKREAFALSWKFSAK